jgi:hypothetical protein
LLSHYTMILRWNQVLDTKPVKKSTGHSRILNNVASFMSTLFRRLMSVLDFLYTIIHDIRIMTTSQIMWVTLFLTHSSIFWPRDPRTASPVSPPMSFLTSCSILYLIWDIIQQCILCGNDKNRLVLYPGEKAFFSSLLLLLYRFWAIMMFLKWIKE